VVPRECPGRLQLQRGTDPSASRTTYDECGEDHAALIGEVLDVGPVDKVDHPWCWLRPYYIQANSVKLERVERLLEPWWA
jgi:hypothetical protein